MSSRIAAERVYEPASRGDGLRILVDRLWPRGVRTEEAHWHAWRKDLALVTATHDLDRSGARVLATVLRRIDAAMARVRA